jgi:hypothetical protein
MNCIQKTFDGDSNGKSPCRHPVHFSLTLQTLTSFIITLLFLSRSNEMATDIGSLAPGLDGHVRTWGNPHNFFRCTPIPLYYLVVKVTNKSVPILCTYPSATIIDTFAWFGRPCLFSFAWFLQQFSHSHYNSVPFTH